MPRRHVATLLAVCVAGLWGALLAWSHWKGEPSVLDRIEAPLIDLRFLIDGRRPAPDLLTIVSIDDRTVGETGTYPLPRAVIADLVARIAARGPKAIAIDLLLVEAGSVAGDRKLADVLDAVPAVIAAAATFDQSIQTSTVEADGFERVPRAQHLLLPLPLFIEVAAVGVVNVGTDSSGTPRHVPLVLRLDDRLIPSFALRVASIALKQDPQILPDRISFGGRRIDTDIGFNLPLRFYGSRGTIRTISAADILSGRLDEAALKDRIVVIGATVTGGGDVFPTPFDPILPGVEVLATAISHLTSGDNLLRDNRVRATDVAVAVILPMFLVLLLSWHRSVIAFGLIALVAMLWIGLTIVAFKYGIWLSATLPVVAAAPPAMIFGAMRLWLDRNRADHLAEQRATLRHFQPPSLTARLAKDPDFLVTPIRQQAALVFIDLNGFTSLSESLGPDETYQVLRGFHSLIDEQAVRHNGLVAAFMGDGAMIIFGIPDPGPTDADDATRACVDLCRQTRDWIASLPESVSSRISFKIGAHFGPVVASRLGGESHQHITAIGDTVNVASRLMDVAKDNRTELALSDELFQAALSARSVLDTGVLAGPVKVPIRGRSGAIGVWLWRSA